MNNIVEIFIETAKRFPNNTALIHKSHSISYKNLARKVNKAAGYFQQKGIKSGSKCLVFVPMSIELYVNVLALFSIGAEVVFVDEWAKYSRLKKALNVVPVDAVIVPANLIWLGYILPPFTSIGKKIKPFSDNSDIVEKAEINQEFSSKKTALITFTTGSTGLPKAADRSHFFLKEQFDVLNKEIDANPQDVCLVTLPIVLLSILGTGACAIIPEFNQKKPEKLDPVKQFDLIIRHKVSMIISSPFFINQLAEYGNNSENSVRKIITGGAPVFPDMAKKIGESFPESMNLIAYGSTEAEPISMIEMKTVSQYENILKTGLPVGQCNPNITLKIIKIGEGEFNLIEHSWNDLELKEGETGEIIVSGNHVLDKYFNSEEAFRKNKITDGNIVWHRTGDSGKVIDGNLFLLGRCEQLIKNADGFISPFIVEYQLSMISGVKTGTMLKIDSSNVVVIEKLKSSDENAIVKSMEELGIDHDHVRFVKQIPRDPRHFSKIDYKRLESQLR